MMAPFYELLRTMSEWLNEKGIQKDQAQRYITSLFLALSEDAVVNSKERFKNTCQRLSNTKRIK